MNQKVTFYTSITRVFILFAFFYSCSSNNDECEVGLLEYPNSEQVFDNTEYSQSLMECRLPRVQTYRVSNLTGGEIVANQGTVLFVRPESFEDQNGTFIDGDVTISLIEMYQPGEIISCQLSTNSLNNLGIIEPLLSEGIFYLDITYNDEAVNFLHPIEIFIPSENQGLSLSFFDSPSCSQIECQVLWEINTAVKVIEEPYTSAGEELILGYRSFIFSAGWKSIARYNDNQNLRSTLYNKVPSGYNKTNSNVFIKYQSQSTAIGLFSEFKEDVKVFSEKHKQIPENTTADIIFISVQNNQYVFANSRIITQPNLVTATLNTNTGTEAQFINFINNQ